VTKVPDRIGQVVGQRYELLSVVGRGGQGMVYRARDRWMQREVALKAITGKAAKDPQMVERLMREQQAMSVLKGTAAVELFDVCRGNGGELCLVMELLKGQDLDEHLYDLSQKRQRLPLPRLAEIIDPIVRTLETAHAAGILHRDLKPANIFLCETGGVRLLDFGMARLKGAAPLTAAGTVMGSPSFMAPEAWGGMSDLLDPRADVYSLGVVLFVMLTGDLPFAGATLQQKFISATTGERPSLRALRPDLPRGVDDWVKTALAVNRDERFANVRALWSAFCTTFRVQPPNLGGRPSLWAAAMGAVQKITGSKPVPPAEPPASSAEPSFAREALARSVFRVPSETTMDLDEGDLERVGSPPRKPPPPRRK
jgi:eukaryotic-like serine/threonine-protein kinase